MSNYRCLNASTLDTEVTCHRPTQTFSPDLSLASPAIEVMTDLTKVSAMTISANLSLAEAEEKMIASGIRLLFVTNQYNHVTGILTSKDLSDERIMAVVTRTGTQRNQLTVRDIMTVQHRIEVLDMNDVATARVGDIVATLKRMGRQHALVVERSSAGNQVIRGMLSSTQIGKLLGETIDTSHVAGNLASLAAMN